MPTPDAPTPHAQQLDELYGLIADIEIALLTTRRRDGHLVTRPMATQRPGREVDAGADLFFVTEYDTEKVDELAADPHVNLGYLDGSTYEWVSVSGTARVSQDRELIRRLYRPDWKAWFGDEGGERDGGPDDPRLALLLVDAAEAHYAEARHSRPVAAVKFLASMVTGERAELLREEHVEDV